MLLCELNVRQTSLNVVIIVIIRFKLGIELFWRPFIVIPARG